MSIISWDDFDDQTTPQSTPVLTPTKPAQSAIVTSSPAMTTSGADPLEQARLSNQSLDVEMALADLDMGAARIRAEDKRMINSTSDVNQLIPFKCEWAWNKYLQSSANHWMPQEVAMTADIALWKSADGLSVDERNIVMRSLGYFSTADTVVATNDYDEPKETRVWVHESAKILDFRVSEPDLVELNVFGHVVIWCPNDRAPKPPIQEPISPTCHVNISPYSVVRVNGVLCWAKQIQVGLSRQAPETRFVAEKIK